MHAFVMYYSVIKAINMATAFVLLERKKTCTQYGIRLLRYEIAPVISRMCD